MSIRPLKDEDEPKGSPRLSLLSKLSCAVQNRVLNFDVLVTFVVRELAMTARVAGIGNPLFEVGSKWYSMGLRTAPKH